MQRGSSGELVEGSSDSRGKHKISAELKRLEQETRFLQDDLEQLERTEKVSAVCKELQISIQTRQDPLLTLTNGPINPIWDKWFEGQHNSSGCRCPIL